MTTAARSRSRSTTSAASATKKCYDLSLKPNYEVIKTVEKEPKIGVRKLADLFNCDKTQISYILKKQGRNCGTI